MAQSPTATGATRRKQSGPRVVKDKVLLMGYVGQFTTKPVFYPNSEAAMEALMANRELQIEKITVPKGKSRKKAGEGDTATNVAQAA